MNTLEKLWPKPRQPVPTALFVGTIIAMIASGSPIIGCSHAWEDYDPRLSGDSSSSTTSSSSGSTSVTSSSSSSAMGGAGGMMTSSSSSGGMDGGAGGMGGGGGGGGGTGGSGGGGVEKCGGTSTLVADYDGNDIVGLWDGGEWGGATRSESGGELVIDLPMGSPDNSGADIVSEYFYDFRDDFASIEVTNATGTSGSTWAFFAVGRDSDNYIEIYQEGGKLYFGRELLGAYTDFKDIPYDPMAHRYWQLRERAGQTYYETSPDGQNWTTQFQIQTTALAPVDYVQLVLGAGSDAGQANASQARFDRLNGGGVPKQKHCPIRSITDDFNDGNESVQWERSWEDQNGMLDENGGQFVLHYAPNAEAYAGLASARAFDMTESAIAMEVPGVPMASADAYLGLELNGHMDDDIEMILRKGVLEFGVEIGGSYQKFGSVPYSPTDHRWWRMRHTSNTVYWETAPDGKTWTIGLQVSPPPVDITIMEVEIEGGTWSAQATPGDCRVDNVNLLP